MFNANDKVSHPGYGACEVTDVCQMDMTGEQTLYYKLVPCLEDSTSVYIPVSKAETIGLRPLITETQAESLLHSLTSVADQWLPDAGARQKLYRSLFTNNTVENLFDAFSAMGTLIKRKQEKELGSVDKAMLENLRRKAVSEVAVATDKSLKQTIEQTEELVLQSS